MKGDNKNGNARWMLKMAFTRRNKVYKNNTTTTTTTTTRTTTPTKYHTKCIREQNSSKQRINTKALNQREPQQRNGLCLLLFHIRSGKTRIF